MESLGNATGTWPGWSLQWAQGSAGAAELSLRQQHCCEPWVSWDQSPLPAAQQALLRSGVGGKRPLWLARALEGTTRVPKDGLPCRQTPVVWGRQKESKGNPLGSRSSPLCPDQASSDPDQPWQHLLNPSQDRCHSPREEPSTPKQQGHPGPQQGAGMGRRTYERVRK